MLLHNESREDDQLKLIIKRRKNEKLISKLLTGSSYKNKNIKKEPLTG